jgi:hypothetical protein
VHVTSPHPEIPLQLTWQRPCLAPLDRLPHVTSLHALVPAHVMSQSAVPQVMLLHALVPVHVIVQDAASVQSMLSQPVSLHVMSQWWPSGQ